MRDGPLHVIVPGIGQALNRSLWACNGPAMDLCANTAPLYVINQHWSLDSASSFLRLLVHGRAGHQFGIHRNEGNGS